jgi:hypothetical protein
MKKTFLKGVGVSIFCAFVLVGLGGALVFYAEHPP